MLTVLFLSAIAANPSAANAVDIYTRYFAGVSGGKPCYARYYDPDHLNAHPKQTVRRIVVDFDQDQRDDKVTKNTPADFQAGFGFMLKRSKEWYGQELFCKVTADHFDCYLDGASSSPYPDVHPISYRKTRLLEVSSWICNRRAHAETTQRIIEGQCN